MSKIPISVVILTKNEAERITDCIKSVSDWADEILVIDDGSSDGTQNIAQELGVQVIEKKMIIEGEHRNWSYAQAKNDWILSLDADERPTAELKDEITQCITSNPEEVVFTIPRRNFIKDYWIRYGGLYPSAQIKLIRKGRFKWEEVEVHPRAFVDGECGHLTCDLIHYTYRNWGDFLKKLNNQTTLEAKKWFKLSKEDPKKARYKMNLLHALWRTFDRFFRAYIFKKGYKDRFIGFMVAYFGSLYQMVSFAKYKELEKNELEKRDA